MANLEKVLANLEINDPNWGVLGNCGKTQEEWSWLWTRVLLGSRRDWGTTRATFSGSDLDEIVLILRKASGLRFDDSLPNFHMYGADICLRAAKKGMKCYAISTCCIHNRRQTLVLPKEFYECRRHIKRVWKDCLPTQTTRIRITRFSFPMYGRKLREFYLRHILQKECGGTQVQNVQRLLQQMEGMPINRDLEKQRC